MSPERHDTAENSQLFGRYRIRGLLGEGGLGRLYLAEQTGIEGFTKIVTLKRILPQLADSAAFRTLFLNEARVAARLEHPNIVTTYELGEGGGTYFIAMEYLPGEDLESILARCRTGGPLPVATAAFLAQQCANGLHYAHELRDALGRPCGVVHRDVNPSNIFVTYHGAVKLLDFGVAKASTGNDRTAPGAFKGKYAYCAPEQLAGTAVDGRTDLFSLGIVLWECLTGERLFDHATDAGTIDAVRAQPIVPPSQRRPEVPLALNHITMRALFRDPAHRYQSAAELSEALDQFLAGDRQRPAGKSVGQWLQSLFGAERAALKTAIARGAEIEQALAMLGPGDSTAGRRDDSTGRERTPPMVRPRPLWSTSLDRTTPPAGSQAAPRSTPGPAAPLPALPPPAADRKRARFPWLGVAAAVVGIAAFLAGRPRTPPGPRPPALAGLRVESSPPGAQVFVDGDPSGLVTPALLRHLPAGRTVEVRLLMAGHRPAARRIQLAAGEESVESFALEEDVGTVHLEGLSPRALLYLDDTLADPRRPLSASAGPHRLRIEEAGDVVFSDGIEVRPGQQTIRIQPRRKRP